MKNNITLVVLLSLMVIASGLFTQNALSQKKQESTINSKTLIDSGVNSSQYDLKNINGLTEDEVNNLDKSKPIISPINK